MGIERADCRTVLGWTGQDRLTSSSNARNPINQSPARGRSGETELRSRSNGRLRLRPVDWIYDVGILLYRQRILLSSVVVADEDGYIQMYPTTAWLSLARRREITTENLNGKQAQEVFFILFYSIYFIYYFTSCFEIGRAHV